MKLLLSVMLMAFTLMNAVAQAQKIKILTYNIYHGEEKYNRGKSNLKRVAAVINKYKPDFVVLQEVDSMTQRTASLNRGVKRELVKELATMTSMHGYFAKAIDYSEGGYGEGMLSKYIIKPVIHHLAAPAGGEARALILVEHRLSNGKKIILAGTHFCHEFEENRIAQAKEVVDIIMATDLPVIIGGDFNIIPESMPYKIITKKLDDVAAQFGQPALTFPFVKPRVRLDYFFINKGNRWRILNVKVIDGEDASDHKPIFATLELQ